MQPTNMKNSPQLYTSSKKTHSQFKKEVFELVGADYQLLGEYNGAKTKIAMKHIVCGHEYEVTPSNFLFRNSRCPKCSLSGKSRMETELFEFIKELYPGEVIQGQMIDGKEIDIYLPELKLGFEFNGVYWHSDKYREQEYHQDKILGFKEKGINVISIFEDDWIFNREVVQKFVIKKIRGIRGTIGILTEEKISRNMFIAILEHNGLRKIIPQRGAFYRLVTFEGKTSAIYTKQKVGKGKNKVVVISNLNIFSDDKKVIDHFYFRLKKKNNTIEIIVDIQDHMDIVDLVEDKAEFIETIPADFMYLNGNTRIEHNYILMEEQPDLLKVFNCGYMRFQIKI